MKKLFLFGLINLLLISCFWDEPTNTTHLVKDFNLGWWAEPRYQSLYLNSNHNEYGGGVIISETVFAIGFDDNFIIAKQHPNNDDTISWNNINEYKTWKLDSIPSDTLGEQQSYVKINGEWHGISNGRNTHRDLFPDKKITYYYIVDTRDYDTQQWSSKNKVHKFENENDFKQSRKKLGVPDNLNFTIVDKELE